MLHVDHFNALLLDPSFQTLIWQVLSKSALTVYLILNHASRKEENCIESFTHFSFHLDPFYLFQALVVPPVTFGCHRMEQNVAQTRYMI